MNLLISYMFTPLVLILVLLIGAVISYWPMSERRLRGWGVGAMLAGSTVATVIALRGFGAAQFYGSGVTWHVDGLAALLTLMIAVVSFTASVVSHRYLAHEHREGMISLADLRLYYFCLPLFVAAMYVSTLANNAGVLWIALEATTLATTLLVAFYRKRSAIEAAWKYVILCSLGISIGLVGVLLTGAAASSGSEHAPLFLSSLQDIAAAGNMNVGILKFAFVFLFVGIGTKVGFVPMHTWLPDAHSKTPSPISALLSGLLLNVAFVGLLRFKFITDTALQDGGQWTGMFFLIFGLSSILLPALMMLIQKNYKRLLAYSSIEHMGLMAVSVGLGPAGLIPAFIHMPAHALAKSGMFYGSGEILERYKTTESLAIRDLASKMPTLAFLFMAMLVLLLGMPPSGLFTSEIIMIGYGLQQHVAVTLVVVLGLTIAFVGMMRHVIDMLWTEQHEHDSREPFNSTYLMMSLHLVLVIALCIFALTPAGLQFMVNLVSSTIPGAI